MNIVGDRSVMSGSIDCDKDLYICGRFEGTIVTKGAVYVYPEGIVKGTVKAKDLTVFGRIQGEIVVSNRLSVKNSASLEARISTRFLDWEDGARLEGEVDTFF